MSPQQKDWLTRRGSLTWHLQLMGHVTLEVLSECMVPADSDQNGCLAVPLRASLWMREVMLLVEGNPMVVAHSVTPLQDSRSIWKAMRRLHTRPLADILYFDRAVERSMLVNRLLFQGHRLYRCAMKYGRDPNLRSRLWARRSVFIRHGAPLLVTEAFLPRFWRSLYLRDREYYER
ncbi:chorismate--pyruvate lyase family protein [Candidatus Pandoraea novymonadis]|nr:chorismate lyase [Candidatus Pandoraea novymonadis]